MADPRMEIVQIYRVNRIKVLERGPEELFRPVPR
jgi:hypothetical protein